MKVDLHLHTTLSDGSMSIADTVKFAKRMGLAVVAITDHDTMAGAEEAEEEGRRQGLRVLPGTELSAVDPDTGRFVHILGYHVREPQTVSAVCRPYLENRHETNLKALERVREAGYAIDADDVARYAAKSGVLYRQHIMRALMHRGYTQTIYGKLYDELFGAGGTAVVRGRYMSAREAVRLIKDAGGLAVLAHPFQYDSIALLPDLARWGLDGVEWKHYSQTAVRETETAREAARLGLFLTGGSDWHGMYSKARLLPGMMNVELPADHPLLV